MHHTCLYAGVWWPYMGGTNWKHLFHFTLREWSWDVENYLQKLDLLIDWFSTFFPYFYTGILTLLLTSLLSACLQYFNRSSKSKALYENKTIPVNSAGIASLSAPRHYHCKKIEYSCLLVNLIWFRSYRTQVSLGYGGGPARYSRKRSSIFWMFLKASLPR